MSSPTRSASASALRTDRGGPVSVVIALGTNLGDRDYELRRAVGRLAPAVRVVRRSPVIETEPVGAPWGSGRFLNMVVAGWTHLGAPRLLQWLHAIEKERIRPRRMRNEPRRIDLDLILYGAYVIRTREITVPHPRYLERAFVRNPLATLRLPWVDPTNGVRIDCPLEDVRVEPRWRILPEPTKKGDR